MISYRFVPISSQKGVLFLRHPVVERDMKKFCNAITALPMTTTFSSCPTIDLRIILTELS